ncbi:MAG: cyclophilin family peptidyl-prolyl cis-trans isomerase [Planctomycetota bacterium]|jgi:cyclophilin family peptidyl-prolyl cis-trans isomerase
MSRLLKALLIAQLLVFLFPVEAGEVTIITSPQQRVIFETDFGNLVFTLYPDVAPKHVAQFIKLVETGAYDSTHFFRVVPGFVIQLSDIFDRKTPLTDEHKAANQRLEAEFSSNLKHHAGTLSMARQPDDPDSATSSFSILLGKSPHLDGEYTIFGELDSGDSVLREMLSISREGEAPLTRLSVNKAYIIKHFSTYYEKYPFDPVNRFGSIVVDETVQVNMDQKDESRTRLIVIMILAIIVVSLLGFFLYARISKARLLSLMLVNVLISVFLLFIILTPVGHKNSWIAAMLFIGMFSTFRLLSQFESKRD